MRPCAIPLRQPGCSRSTIRATTCTRTTPAMRPWQAPSTSASSELQFPHTNGSLGWRLDRRRLLFVGARAREDAPHADVPLVTGELEDILLLACALPGNHRRP